MQSLEWLRPTEISIKSSLVGFFGINEKNVEERELDNLVGLELADFRRISYGNILDNRWVINAAALGS